MTRPYRRLLRSRLDLLEDRITPIANDMFADAEVLTGENAYVFLAGNFDLFGTEEPFTGEPGEPDHAAVSDPIQSAWYRWTAPISGLAFVELFDFSFPEQVGVVAAVYTGDAVDALTEVTSGIGEFVTGLAFDAVAGTTYSIAVDGPGDALVAFDLRLAVFEPPANDDFADAFVLSGSPAPVTVAPSSSLSASSLQSGEPNHAAGIDFFGNEIVLGPSVWYSWTAPTTGRVILDLDILNDFGETVYAATAGAAAVYTGNSIDNLTLVANAGDAFGPEFTEELRLPFDTAAGTTYRIAVAGAHSFPNDLHLKIINHSVPGAVAIDGSLFVAGTAKNDIVKVTPVGAADDGSTGVKIKGNYGGQQRTDTLAQPITSAEFFLTDGHDTAELTGSLAVHVEADLGEGNNTFRGGRGDTLVRAGDGNNSVRTDDGVDFVLAGDGNNDVRTGGGDDVVRIGKGNNTIVTGGGDDAVIVAIPQVVFEELIPGTGANVIDTGDGDDFLNVLSDGPSLVTTGAGNDSVSMEGNGNDLIRTGDGDDFVRADAGSNVIFAGAGNDQLFAGREFGDPVDGSNFVDAGDGNDRVRVSSNGPSLVLAGAGNDDVTIGFRFPVGGKASPYLTGPAVVFGGDGDDVIISGGGNDLLDGGNGKDILVGGLGADVLFGGAGTDVLFDGIVAVAKASLFSPPPLRTAFAAWNPADPATFAAVRSKLVVTPDAASKDLLLGGSGIDWFWSDDPLDLLDIAPIEVKN